MSNLIPYIEPCYRPYFHAPIDKTSPETLDKGEEEKENQTNETIMYKGA